MQRSVIVVGSYRLNIPGRYTCLGLYWSCCFQCIVPPFARPITCPSVVCLWQVGALRKRWEIGLWLLWGSYRKSPLGYTVYPSSTPCDYPFPPNWGLPTPSRNLQPKYGPCCSVSLHSCVDCSCHVCGRCCCVFCGFSDLVWPIPTRMFPYSWSTCSVDGVNLLASGLVW